MTNIMTNLINITKKEDTSNAFLQKVVSETVEDASDRLQPWQETTVPVDVKSQESSTKKFHKEPNTMVHKGQ